MSRTSAAGHDLFEPVQQFPYILFMGAVSGAHLNPAVSLAFALRGDFPWRRVPGYIIIQLIGATLSVLSESLYKTEPRRIALT